MRGRAEEADACSGFRAYGKRFGGSGDLSPISIGASIFPFQVRREVEELSKRPNCFTIVIPLKSLHAYGTGFRVPGGLRSVNAECILPTDRPKHASTCMEPNPKPYTLNSGPRPPPRRWGAALKPFNLDGASRPRSLARLSQHGGR